MKTNSLAGGKKKKDKTLAGKWESRAEMTDKSEQPDEGGLIQKVKNINTRPISDRVLEIIFTENSKHCDLLV